jgi:hypothetical protein
MTRADDSPVDPDQEDPVEPAGEDEPEPVRRETGDDERLRDQAPDWHRNKARPDD